MSSAWQHRSDERAQERDMNHANTATSAPVRTAVGRRQLLRAGGLTIGAGAILAACGEPGETGLARIGESPTTTALPPGEVTDPVLLRTAAALGYTVVDAYDRILDSGHVTYASAVKLLERCRADHRSIAEKMADASGTKVTEGSERLDSLYVTPALEAVEAAADQVADSLAFAHALECLVASTHQAFVSWLTEPSNRRASIGAGAVAAGNAARLALVIRPGLAGVKPETSEDGSPVISPAAVPSAFGSLAGVDVKLGAESDTGSREVFTFETPSLNSLEYLD